MFSTVGGDSKHLRTQSNKLGQVSEIANPLVQIIHRFNTATHQLTQEIEQNYEEEIQSSVDLDSFALRMQNAQN